MPRLMTGSAGDGKEVGQPAIPLFRHKPPASLLTFYSYYAYSPNARPAWGPGRDGGLGWGSSGGPAGLGKRTPGSRERNDRPRGHYDPRAFGQLAGIHCRFRSALRSEKVPPAAGAVRALSTSHLLSPRWAAPAPPSRALERQPPRRRPEPPQERSPMSRRLKRFHPAALSSPAMRPPGLTCAVQSLNSPQTIP